MKEKVTILLMLFSCVLSSTMHAESAFDNFVAPPANDECANAIELTVNSNFLCGTVTQGTVAEATASSESAVCPSASINADDDVWFKFVATDTSHNIDLLNITGSQTDLYHSIYDGGVSADCSSLNIVFCSNPNSSSLSNLTVGNTYFIRVFTVGTGAHDTTFDVCIGTTPMPPANDDCANAETIGVFPFNSSLDASAATNNAGFINVSGCGDAMNDGVWYTFLGDGSEVTVVVAPTGWDAKIGIYSGSCGSFTCSAFSDDGAVGITEAATFITTSGVTYYINVGHPDDTTDQSEGVFTIDVTSTVLSIDDLVTKGFAYYPNPVRNELTMQANENIESINLFNMIGQQLKAIEISNLNSYQLDMSSYASGIYFVKAKVGESTGTFKIIKK